MPRRVHGCWPQQTHPNITIDGVLTVVPVINAVFPDTVFGFGPNPLIYTSGDWVTNVTGTMTVDCGRLPTCRGGTYQLTYIPSTQLTSKGDGSYLYRDSPRYLAFGANGNISWILYDRAFTYLHAPDVNQTPILWASTRVPVPDATIVSMPRVLVGFASPN